MKTLSHCVTVLKNKFFLVKDIEVITRYFLFPLFVGANQRYHFFTMTPDDISDIIVTNC